MKNVLLDHELDVVWIELQPHVHVSSAVRHEGRSFYGVDIDPQFQVDVAYFRVGRYSYFSDEAKRRILEKNNLLYNLKDNTGVAYSDVKVLALMRHPSLRDELNRQLGFHEKAPQLLPGETYGIGESDELLPPPKPDWFIDSSAFRQPSAQPDGFDNGDAWD